MTQTSSPDYLKSALTRPPKHSPQTIELQGATFPQSVMAGQDLQKINGAAVVTAVAKAEGEDKLAPVSGPQIFGAYDVLPDAWRCVRLRSILSHP